MSAPRMYSKSTEAACWLSEPGQARLRAVYAYRDCGLRHRNHCPEQRCSSLESLPLRQPRRPCDGDDRRDDRDDANAFHRASYHRRPVSHLTRSIPWFAADVPKLDSSTALQTPASSSLPL